MPHVPRQAEASSPPSMEPPGDPPLPPWPGQQAALRAGSLVFRSNFDSGNIAAATCVIADPHQPPSPSVFRKAAAAAERPGTPARDSSGSEEDTPATPPDTAAAPARPPAPPPAPAAARAPAGGGSPVDDSKCEEVFELWIAPDCAGSKYETNNRSWFYFAVEGGKCGQAVTFRIMNSNPHQKLYDLDMRPVVRCLPSAPEWIRVPSRVTHMTVAGFGVINIPFTFPADGDVVEVAFTYPYTVLDLAQRVQQWEERARLRRSESLRSLLDGVERQAAQEVRERRASTEAGRPPDPAAAEQESRAAAAALTRQSSEEGVYFFREAPSRSPDRVPVDLLTVSSMAGLTGQEPDVAGFGDRRYCFISARVHPGEVPASFIVDGLIDFLLSSEPAARALRNRFVFKVMPMLNPDGVRRGHSRADAFGRNLNRHYGDPCPEEMPSVCAARELFLQLHKTGRLDYYIDIHAHHSKRGCFFYGNALADPAAQADAELLALLMGRLCPHFDVKACNFSKENMCWKDARDESKEGSARVALHRDTGFGRTYTLECNYNTSNLTTFTRATSTAKTKCGRSSSAAAVAAAAAAEAAADTDADGVRRAPRYDPPLLRGIGRSLGLALLVHCGDPASTGLVPPEERERLLAQLREEQATQKKPRAKRQRPQAAFMKAARGQEARGGIMIL
eukprot:TRINITY_DN15432_c0_g1_i1.p1 TRINITY_DN15432_c0_g1~~TRINITY_DN15432_c0_g1_i1.p1  ORF type:complete len:677 (+),score=244.25 TRINITY_DN15432_c0_g1_i1:75-2105(+)